MTVAYLLAQLHGLADGYKTGRAADGASDRHATAHCTR